MKFYHQVLDERKIAYTSETEFYVQIGKNKSAYKNRFTVKGNLSLAVLLYDGLNVHSGYKKRLYSPNMNKPVLARVII